MIIIKQMVIFFLVEETISSYERLSFIQNNILLCSVSPSFPTHKNKKIKRKRKHSNNKKICSVAPFSDAVQPPPNVSSKNMTSSSLAVVLPALPLQLD